jgi:hypothetical protein
MPIWMGNKLVQRGKKLGMVEGLLRACEKFHKRKSSAFWVGNEHRERGGKSSFPIAGKQGPLA